MTRERDAQVTLVLCLPDGTLLGSLAPFAVDVPWWQEAWPVVDAARAAHGIEVTVLRLLHGAPTAIGTGGGAVTYLAEVSDRPRVPLARWDGDDPLRDHPLRMPWARPGGPAVDLAWADRELERRGMPRTGQARQIRTWNLSSL